MPKAPAQPAKKTATTPELAPQRDVVAGVPTLSAKDFAARGGVHIGWLIPALVQSGQQESTRKTLHEWRAFVQDAKQRAA